MAVNEEMKIVLQVGTELRVTNKGEVVVSNPELELAREERAADAVLLYRFYADRGEHIFRLVEPVADHKHMKVHRAND
jgi:quinol monooxygenase YgiN